MPKLLNLDKEHLLKMSVFLSNPDKVKAVITSVIKMLELPNFGHITKSFCFLSPSPSIHEQHRRGPSRIGLIKFQMLVTCNV